MTHYAEECLITLFGIGTNEQIAPAVEAHGREKAHKEYTAKGH